MTRTLSKRVESNQKCWKSLAEVILILNYSMAFFSNFYDSVWSQPNSSKKFLLLWNPLDLMVYSGKLLVRFGQFESSKILKIYKKAKNFSYGRTFRIESNYKFALSSWVSLYLISCLKDTHIISNIFWSFIGYFSAKNEVMLESAEAKLQKFNRNLW